jgi:hypothetical protein
VKVPASEGLANHTVPESCVRNSREARHEALTGVRAGQPLSGAADKAANLEW